MKKREVHVRKTYIGVLEIVFSIAVGILLFLVIAAFSVKIISIKDATSSAGLSKDMILLIIIFIFSIAAIIVAWAIAIYILETINRNRKLISDTIKVLNKTKIFNDG